VDERPIFVVVGDFNENSRPDLVVVNYHVNITGVLLDYGNSNFRTQKTFSTNRNPPNIAFDVTNYNDHTVGIFLAYDKGSFNTFMSNVASCDRFERCCKDTSYYYWLS